MGKKLYETTSQGGIKFTSHRMGQVRIANYVYDIWLPILGATAVAVYSVYCRLERAGTVKSITQADVSKACRIGTNKLAVINKQLEECGFIKITQPQGYRRLIHWTTEIEVYDPPTEVSAEIVEKYQHPQGYQALSTWLVADEIAPEIPDSIPDDTKQHSDEIPDSIPNVASLVLNPSDIEKRPVASDEKTIQQQNAESAADFIATMGEKKAVQAEAQAAPPPAEKPWLRWYANTVRPRNGIIAEDLQRVGWLIERHTGLAPTDSEIKGWVKGLATIYQAGKGKWPAIESGILTTWDREEKYRPGHANGFVKEVRKAAIEQATGVGW